MSGEVIERPNGKPYRPRRVVAYGVGEDGEGVIVLGTHDLSRAQALADELARYVAGSGFVAVDPWRGWWRDGFESGERRWVSDEERGRAGVCFREIAEKAVTGQLATDET
jgi:hypothetical protein